MTPWLLAAAVAVLLVLYRRRSRRDDDKTRAVIVIGSGGHTGEMLRLTSSLLHRDHYSIYFLVADTDTTSRAKFEADANAVRGEWIQIPRAREVHQSWLSTPFSAARSLLVSFRILASLRPHLVVANGPGTCVPVCYVGRLLGARIVFCESWCRVRDLSLTGKIVYPLAHRFVVHWKKLTLRYPRAEFIGDIRTRDCM